MHTKSTKTCVDCGTKVSRSDVLRCKSCNATKKWADAREAPVPPPNPSGLCLCGCGNAAPIAKYTDATAGHLRGHAMRYCMGHGNAPKKPRYIVDEATGCWEWQWSRDSHGYGVVGGQKAHRVVYRQFRGPVPAGLTLDHLCRNRGCVNPDHLEAVTNTENIRRGAGAKLSMTIADEIRALYATGEYTQIQLSERFGVNQANISKVILRRTWAHHEDAA